MGFGVTKLWGEMAVPRGRLAGACIMGMRPLGEIHGEACPWKVRMMAYLFAIFANKMAVPPTMGLARESSCLAVM